MPMLTSISAKVNSIGQTIKFHLWQKTIDLLPEEKKPYHKLSAQELYTMIQSQENFFLLDVRTLLEYHAERLPQSIHINVEDIPTTIENMISDPTAKIVLYCHSGERSVEAAEKLYALGYQNIYYLKKGIAKWPYETEQDFSG